MNRSRLRRLLLVVAVGAMAGISVWWAADEIGTALGLGLAGAVLGALGTIGVLRNRSQRRTLANLGSQLAEIRADVISRVDDLQRQHARRLVTTTEELGDQLKQVGETLDRRLAHHDARLAELAEQREGDRAEFRQAIEEQTDHLRWLDVNHRAATEELSEAVGRTLSIAPELARLFERSGGEAGSTVPELPEALASSRLFDAEWYVDRYGVADDPPGSALRHYLEIGWSRGADPGPWFSVEEYRQRTGISDDVEPLSDFHRRERLGALPPARPRSAERPEMEGELRWDYLVSGAYRWPATFVLYRIVGNDLPPRHPLGQSRKLLHYILENEEELEGCERWWIVNNIVDPAEEARIIELLERHEQRYLVRRLDRDLLRRTGWNWLPATLPKEGLFLGPERRGRTFQRRVDAVYSPKVRTAIGINAARNLALSDGRPRATWILPWDGTCLVPQRAWRELIDAVSRKPYLRYVMVPTARLRSTELLVDPSFQPSPDAEPMVAFRRDAHERFDETREYGNKDKVALLYHLGVEGPWQAWDWRDDAQGFGGSTEARQFTVSGWVARLPSGSGREDRDASTRSVTRSHAVRAFIDELDASLAKEIHLPAAPVTHAERVDVAAEQRTTDETALSQLRQDVAQLVVGKAVEPDRIGTTGDAYAVGLAVWRGEAELEEGVQEGVLRSITGLLSRVDGDAEGASGRELYLLDAARLLMGKSSEEARNTELLTEWCRDRARWLEQGQHEVRAARDLRGTWFDVEVAAIAGYLGDVTTLLESVRRTQERLLHQLEPSNRLISMRDGDWPRSGKECHRILLLAQGWLVMLRLAESVGLDLRDADVSGRSLRVAFSELLQDPPPEDVSNGSGLLLRERWGYLRDTLFSTQGACGVGLAAPNRFPERFGIRPYWAIDEWSGLASTDPLPGGRGEPPSGPSADGR